MFVITVRSSFSLRVCVASRLLALMLFPTPLLDLAQPLTVLIAYNGKPKISSVSVFADADVTSDALAVVSLSLSPLSAASPFRPPPRRLRRRPLRLRLRLRSRPRSRLCPRSRSRPRSRLRLRSRSRPRPRLRLVLSSSSLRVLVVVVPSSFPSFTLDIFSNDHNLTFVRLSAVVFYYWLCI